MAGFYYTARKVDEDQDFDASNLFKGFDWIQKIAVYAAIETAFYFICLLPSFFLNDMDFGILISGDYTRIPVEHLFEGSLPVFMGIIPLLYFSIAWMFAPLLIIFYDMEAWTAMETSRQIITKKWFLFLLFFIVVCFISLIGILGFFIGILFTAPAGLCMIYAAFRDIVGLPNEEKDDVLDHLV